MICELEGHPNQCPVIILQLLPLTSTLTLSGRFRAAPSLSSSVQIHRHHYTLLRHHVLARYVVNSYVSKGASRCLPPLEKRSRRARQSERSCAAWRFLCVCCYTLTLARSSYSPASALSYSSALFTFARRRPHSIRRRPPRWDGEDLESGDPGKAGWSLGDQQRVHGESRVGSHLPSGCHEKHFSREGEAAECAFARKSLTFRSIKP